MCVSCLFSVVEKHLFRGLITERRSAGKGKRWFTLTVPLASREVSQRKANKKDTQRLTISFPLMLCSGRLSSRPRALLISCKPVGPVVGLPRGAASARLKQPSTRTTSYIMGSDRGPALASLKEKVVCDTSFGRTSQEVSPYVEVSPVFPKLSINLLLLLLRTWSYFPIFVAFGCKQIMQIRRYELLL